jgi:ComF family protein
MLCRACRLAPPAYERAVAYGLYDGRMRDAIRALKFNGIRPAARRLGGLLALAIAKLDGQAPAEMLVIPIPLHRSKHAQRSFNQARLIASHALHQLARTHPDWRLTLASRALLRVRATESQTELTPRQRRLNLRGAFAVSNLATVAGKNILLIDDIMTTGATVRAASRVLVDAGAASVWVATLSRARRLNPRRRAALEGALDQPTLPSFVHPVRWQAASENSLHVHSSFSS